MARFKRVSEPSTSKQRGAAERTSKEATSSKPSKHARHDSSDEVVSNAASSNEEETVSEYEGKREKRRYRKAKRPRRRTSTREDVNSNGGSGSDHESDSGTSSGRNADRTLVDDDTPPPPPRRRLGRPTNASKQKIAEKRMRPLEEEYNIHDEDEEEIDDHEDDDDDDDDSVSLDSADDLEASSRTLGGNQGGGRRKGVGNSLKRWRHMAEEERHMLVTRGGLIWQAARPLLAAMSEDDRTEAADVLKGLMRGLDAKLAATLIPGTYPMPRHNQDNPNSTAAMANTYAIQSSMMSWSVENQGMLKDDDDDDDDGGDATLRRLAGGDLGNVSQQSDPDRTLTNDGAPPKGFSADILVLESMLVPEASEILALLRSLEEHDINLERAKRRLEAMKQNAARTDSRAIEAHEKILLALSSSITQVHDSGEPRPMSKAHEAALSEVARRNLPS